MAEVKYFQAASSGLVVALDVQPHQYAILEQIENKQLIEVDAADIEEIAVGKRGVRFELKSQRKEAKATPVEAPIVSDTETEADVQTKSNKNK